MKLIIIFCVLVSFYMVNGQFLPQLSKVVPKVPDSVTKNVPVGQAVSKLKDTATGVTDIAANLLQEFDKFKTDFKKSYSSLDEEILRRGIFLKNYEKILDFNKQLKTFTQRLNVYSDLTLAEFNKRFNGFNKNKVKVPVSEPSPFTPPTKAAVPEHIDWREIGGVSSVKNQGKCASCWAFSGTGALEGQVYRKTKQTVELSPQNLLDCTYAEAGEANDACEGGLVEPTYEYAKKHFGINPESTYTYEGVQGKCRQKNESTEAQCKGFVRLPLGDERALELAVATIGPMSAVMQADLSSFQTYGDGIFYEPECKNDPDSMNHAVLIVGYGKESDGSKYWIVKNSYGTEWGKDGYFKIAKDRNNHCGIATQASFPILS